jgi:hypothetical protein
MKTIIKGILFYITIFLSLELIILFEYIFTPIYIIALIIDVLLVLLCIKYISDEDILKITFQEYLKNNGL